MHVEDGLTGALAGVEDESVVAARALGGDAGAHLDQLGQEIGLRGRELGDVAVGLGLGHHQDVHGRFWRDVFERDHTIGLGYDRGRNLAGNDAGEDGSFGIRHTPILKKQSP